MEWHSQQYNVISGKVDTRFFGIFAIERLTETTLELDPVSNKSSHKIPHSIKNKFFVSISLFLTKSNVDNSDFRRGGYRCFKRRKVQGMKVNHEVNRVQFARWALNTYGAAARHNTPWGRLVNTDFSGPISEYFLKVFIERMPDFAVTRAMTAATCAILALTWFCHLSMCL